MPNNDIDTENSTMDVPIGPAKVSIWADDEVLVAAPNATVSPDADEGYFVADTRLVSGYRIRVAGQAPTLLNSSDIEHYSARFEFTNARASTLVGQLPAGSLQLRIDRSIDGGIHEDYDIVNYHHELVDFELEISVESDFADLFDVKAGSSVRRGLMQTHWDDDRRTLITRYAHEDFRRGLKLRVEKAGSTVQYANGKLLFRVTLAPRQSWHTCLLWLPTIEGHSVRADKRGCHCLVGALQRDGLRRRWVAHTTRFSTNTPEVTDVARRAVEDLASLRLSTHDPLAGDRDIDTWVPAAGVPWFLTLFGRDALVTSLQTLALSPRFALGSLRALGALQAEVDDPARDMEPGKILHEIRRGELATFGLVPHRSYYGSHDATPLYVWTAAQAWRWHGDRDALDGVRPHVERCLAWIDSYGDLDGDGLQEYRTRAGKAGYYNQGWKDAADAIIHADGSLAELPIALCERQGYVVAAKRAWAQVLEDVYRERGAARRLRVEADRLAALIEERFWWEEQGPTTSPSTAASGPSPRSPRTPATSCGPKRSTTRGPGRSPDDCSRPTCGPVGGSGPCPRSIRPTTPSRIIAVRSGLTTTLFARPASAPTASTTRPSRSPGACSKPPLASKGGACPNCLPASTATR